MRSLFSVATLLACLGLASLTSAALTSAAQDTPAPGFALDTTLDPAGGAFATSTTLSSGEHIVFDGLTIERRTTDDFLIEVLGQIPAQTFASFIVADPEEQIFFLGESSNGVVYRLVPGPSADPEPIATLVNNYDAVVADVGTLYVSAATCGFSCGNSIWRIDLGTSHATLVADVSGASGPLTFDPRTGSLYYGSSPASFPPPPTPSAIYRWSAAQLSGPGGLELADAELIGAGFAGASRMAFDRRVGALYLLENNFGSGVNQVRRVLGAAAQSPVLVQGRPFLSMGNLSIRSGPLEQGVLQAFQPAEGGTLTYTTTDFGALSERVQLHPVRPTVSFTGAGTVGPGPFELVLVGGPPDGFARILVGPADRVRSSEAALFQYSRPDLPLFFGLATSSSIALPGLLRLDAQGELFQSYQNPGGFVGNWAVQVILLDAARKVVGTSAVALL